MAPDVSVSNNVVLLSIFLKDVRSDLDPMDDEVWDQMMLVHPKEIHQPLDVLYEGTLRDHREAIARCFAPDSVEEVKVLLAAEQTEWAAQALAAMQGLDHTLLEKWFELTRYAADPMKSEEDVYLMEKSLMVDCSA